jgi:hypothetical protein
MPNEIMRFRAAPARGVTGKVDRENGVIYGLAVVTMGEALGHGVHLDDEFIDATVKNGNAKQNGLKSRFGHPNMSSSAVGTLLGRVKNFRRDDSSGTPIVRGDLHLTESAKTAPQGDLYTHVLDLAENDPDMFGTSIVFKAGDTYKRDEDGEKVYKYNRDGRYNEDYDRIDSVTFVEQKELRADDVVDEPAANAGGLFSAFSEEQPAAIVTRFLDENPEVFELLKRDDIEEIFSAFRSRYESYRTPVTKQKEPETMAEKENTDQGRSDAVAELKSLKEAFPTDLAFAVEAFEAGFSVEQAKAKRHDKIEQELSEANAKIEELSATPEVAPVQAEGADPVEHLEAGLGGEVELSEKEEAQSKYDAFIAEGGTTTEFAAKFPKLIDELNK